jgi:hypothetical protein
VLQALHLERLQTLTDNELGASSTNIDDQPPLVVTCHPLRHAEVDQARFLAAGDDVDAASQRSLGDHQEGVRVLHAAKGLGADCPQVFSRDAAQPLTEPGQAGISTVLDRRVQPSLIIQAATEADHLLDPVDHP